MNLLLKHNLLLISYHRHCLSPATRCPFSSCSRWCCWMWADMCCLYVWNRKINGIVLRISGAYPNELKSKRAHLSNFAECTQHFQNVSLKMITNSFKNCCLILFVFPFIKILCIFTIIISPNIMILQCHDLGVSSSERPPALNPRFRYAPQIEASTRRPSSLVQYLS